MLSEGISKERVLKPQVDAATSTVDSPRPATQERLYLPETTTREKFIALQQTINTFYDRVAQVNYETAQSLQEFLEHLETLLVDCYFLDTEEEKIAALNKFQKLLISLYDLYVINLIYPDSITTKQEVPPSNYLFSIYFRDHQGKPTEKTQGTVLDPRIKYFLVPELETILSEQLADATQSHQFASVEDFKNTDPADFPLGMNAVIMEPLGSGELSIVLQKYEEIVNFNLTTGPAKPDNFRDLYKLFSNFRLSTDIGGLYCLSKNLQPIKPLNPLPVQEVHLSLLEQGIPFDIDDTQGLELPILPLVKSDAREVTGSFEARWKALLQELDFHVVKLNKTKRKYFNEALLLLDSDGTPTSELRARAQSRYERMFARVHPHFGVTKVLLTRSGVSANDVVEQGIQSYLRKRGDEKPAAQQLNWYFENMDVLRTRFTVAEGESESAQVCFICFEPTANSYEKPEEVTGKKVAVLAEMTAKALKNPTKNYIVVLDKTVAIQEALFSEHDHQLPPNLLFIETASLTKHQGGARNYFTGMVNYWGPEELWQEILQKQVSSKTSLTELGIAHLPRLPKSEIATRSAEAAQQARTFEQALDKSMQLIPPEGRLQCHSYTYFSFLDYPYLHFLKLVEAKQEFFENTTLKEKLANFFEQNDIHPGILRNEIINIAGFLFNSEEKGMFESGDSFNLDATRLSLSRIETPKIAQEWTDNDTTVVLRISWGRKTKSSTIRKWGGYIGNIYLSKYIRIIKALESAK